ncbi:lipase esterase protein [Venturia nashicola]|nr:lipase esterase protein [Venturia nashicola]
MDITPIGLVRNLLPGFPRFILTALQATLGVSPNADHQDAVTELIRLVARPILGTPSSLVQSQENSCRDIPIFGPMWIAKCTLLKPETKFRGHDCNLGIEEAIIKAIDYLGHAQYRGKFPQIVDVEAEWTGYRGGVSYLARRPDIPEYEQYRKLMQEVEPDSTTILYFHGGAFCLMDPATHRITTSSLAKHSGGRCLSVRYRLAPQHVFPAALLDALVAYLSLLSPPPDSFHTPVPASKITVAGDSSGAGLATSLMLLLLTFRQLNITHLRFHEKDVDISGENGLTPPAAGLAITSPWLDISRSLPSVYRNAKWDIITSPLEDPSSPCPAFPPDSVWPASPPRVETYCEASLVSHPLVSPLAASSDIWHGAPPTFICVGWESMQDESEILARRLHDAGATVMFDGSEGMPHCFAVVPWTQRGFSALERWGSFCKDPAVSKASVSWIKKSGEATKVDFSELAISGERNLNDETVEKLMIRERERRVVLEASLVEKWKGKVSVDRANRMIT